ncbi:glyoxalase Bleomycin resistance, putative [Babesia ovata]|uniref:Glyoxalase Bleomycin resistance, putative n=1 Tax=Babesia ovata TaxID=189622 RepID=A0A2H6KDV5_9APIC|nr:glyoxalase Bleomycin resistance, putative [Babesia ovata]GBE61167.1 glyoxalase Bleomycin resistance, putative [Babesia ovata]
MRISIGECPRGHRRVAFRSAPAAVHQTRLQGRFSELEEASAVVWGFEVHIQDVVEAFAEFHNASGHLCHQATQHIYGEETEVLAHFFLIRILIRYVLYGLVQRGRLTISTHCITTTHEVATHNVIDEAAIGGVRRSAALVVADEAALQTWKAEAFLEKQAQKLD